MDVYPSLAIILFENIWLSTCATSVFFRFTFKKSFPSMNGSRFFKVLSALFLLLQKIIQSSAYRTNLCPLRSSSLSNSFSMMLLKLGLNGPPLCITISVRSYIPFAITPAFRYLCINEITLPSLMVRDSTSISLLWHTVSKNFSKSISTTYS